MQRADSPAPFLSAVYGLRKLRSRAAVPVLCEHVNLGNVVEALADIGDPAAVPALERAAADRRPQLAALARAALAIVRPGDPVPRVAGLLSGDPPRDGCVRVLVSWLIDHPDPRTVPALLGVARANREAYLVADAIEALEHVRCAAAVAGLIDLYDTDLIRGGTWKTIGGPDDLRARITASLRQLTGQSYGPNADQWRRWWEWDGRADPRFQ